MSALILGAVVGACGAATTVLLALFRAAALADESIERMVEDTPLRAYGQHAARPEARVVLRRTVIRPTERRRHVPLAWCRGVGLFLGENAEPGLRLSSLGLGHIYLN